MIIVVYAVVDVRCQQVICWVCYVSITYLWGVFVSLTTRVILSPQLMITLFLYGSCPGKPQLLKSVKLKFWACRDCASDYIKTTLVFVVSDACMTARILVEKIWLRQSSKNNSINSVQIISLIIVMYRKCVHFAVRLCQFNQSINQSICRCSFVVT